VACRAGSRQRTPLPMIHPLRHLWLLRAFFAIMVENFAGDFHVLDWHLSRCACCLSSQMGRFE